MNRIVVPIFLILFCLDFSHADEIDLIFTLPDGIVNGSALDSVNVNNGEFLRWSRASNTWLPYVINGLNYMGTWDVSTQSAPDLSPDAGEYYIVSVADTYDLGQGSLSWAVRDWAIFNGSYWEKIDNSGMVTSVFGNNRSIEPNSGDYIWADIDKTVSAIEDIADVVVSSTPGNYYILAWNDERAYWEATDNSIEDGSITSDLLSGNSVDSSKVIDQTITNSDISSSAAIAYHKLNIADGDLTIDKTNGLQAILDTKINLSGGTIIGELDMGGNDISSVDTIDGLDVIVMNSSIMSNANTIVPLQASVGANYIEANSRATSAFGRTGVVVAESGDYTWGQIDKTISALGDLGDVNIPTTPGMNYFLSWSGNNWMATSTTASTGSVTLSNLDDDSVTSQKVLDGTLTNADISTTAAIEYSKLSIGDGDLSIAKTAELEATLAAKLPLTGGVLGGDLNMGTNNITDVNTVNGYDLEAMVISVTNNSTNIDTKQDLNLSLSTIVGIEHIDGSIIVSDGSNWTAKAGANARTYLGLGSAAVLDAGTNAGNLVQLDGSSRLPAVDGSQITGINAVQLEQMGANDGELLSWGQSSPDQWGPVEMSGINFMGTWDATAAGSAPDDTPVSGDYYLVSSSGNYNLSGITNWEQSDWAIYDGSNWKKIDNTPPAIVTSLFNRIGEVVAESGDYTWDQIDKSISDIGDIADINISSTPSADQTLVWNTDDSEWVVADQSLTPGSITSIHLEAESVNSFKVVNGTLTNDHIATDTLIPYSKLDIADDKLTISQTSGLAASLAALMPLSGGTLTGNLNMGSNYISNVGTINEVNISTLANSVTTNTNSIGTQTSGTVTSVTGTSTIQVTGDPDIEINMNQAGTSSSGYLSKENFTTFDSKEDRIATAGANMFFKGDWALADFGDAILNTTLSGFASEAGTLDTDTSLIMAFNQLVANAALKEMTLSEGNLTEVNSTVLTITNGTDAVIGTGVTIEVKQASSTSAGYLSFSDWNNFNGAIGPDDLDNVTLGTDVDGKLYVPSNAVSVDKIVSGTITNSKFVDGAVTSSKITVSVETKTGNYTVTPTDANKTFLVSGNSDITLPDISLLSTGFAITVKNIDSSETVTVLPTGSDTIDDGPWVKLDNQYSSVKLIADGSSWQLAATFGESDHFYLIGDDSSGRMFSNTTYAQSCKDYLDHPNYAGSTGDGHYWIDIDGVGALAPFKVRCDMTTDAGGWTICASQDFGASSRYLGNTQLTSTWGDVTTDMYGVNCALVAKTVGLGGNVELMLMGSEYGEWQWIYPFNTQEFYSRLETSLIGSGVTDLNNSCSTTNTVTECKGSDSGGVQVVDKKAACHCASGAVGDYRSTDITFIWQVADNYDSGVLMEIGQDASGNHPIGIRSDCGTTDNFDSCSLPGDVTMGSGVTAYQADHCTTDTQRLRGVVKISIRER